ncbi:DUF432 domain-containing protein [Marinimicrobium sp. ABcell2]|uniref:DUF432 domain-containing protein n=1 Tax=Marinimicrobium sp. ABcell2 TaxID=3069751 RepID=UPI0027B41410|nr:DUF432 domain-containing protein [Marinimicrobium sp. ABcell2]MDQ2076996.1 DUF432 domain-containing protein [Marinimicrobium sp. ABcell2]
MNQVEIEASVKLHPWWESVSLNIGQSWHYAVGPLSLYLQRMESQWLLAWEQADEAETQSRLISEETDGIPEALTPTRYIFGQSPASFCLTPLLLDRAIVVKTAHPVKVPPGENVTFYIGSPVAINIHLEQSPAALMEIPTLRLSDTWFGPTTQVGELCYAAKTQARNSRSEVPLRPHRAVTPVTISNQSEELLAIDKLSIPVPHLAVYGQSNGTLWTSPVSLKHTHGDQLAILEVGASPAGAEILSPAREPLQKGGLVRAFTSIFTD